ncbi:hypothetical protein bsdcttw_22970 [Anaerocolumna chitinilytica]|uniref:Uncharacterized protein n=1 Tax=Anaerocolumna chitinilytica TaxID=1727145 RepID=A0A7I8DSJ6_9FIRM|nr:hypothetical protein bsdcttw_22970 [Anaerocolumna chitinilytica]
MYLLYILSIQATDVKNFSQCGVKDRTITFQESIFTFTDNKKGMLHDPLTDDFMPHPLFVCLYYIQ